MIIPTMVSCTEVPRIEKHESQNLNADWVDQGRSGSESDTRSLKPPEKGISCGSETRCLGNFDNHAVAGCCASDLTDLQMKVTVVWLDIDLP